MGYNRNMMNYFCKGSLTDVKENRLAMPERQLTVKKELLAVE